MNLCPFHAICSSHRIGCRGGGGWHTVLFQDSGDLSFGQVKAQRLHGAFEFVDVNFLFFCLSQ